MLWQTAGNSDLVIGKVPFEDSELFRGSMAILELYNVALTGKCLLFAGGPDGAVYAPWSALSCTALSQPRFLVEVNKSKDSLVAGLPLCPT